VNILHLISDWKWTGPSEPVLNMCLGLQQLGHAVTLACQPRAWREARSIATFARERGVNLTDQFELNHHAVLRTTLPDLRRLTRFLRRNSIDVVNTHLSHDHLLGGLAARLCSRRVVVIRADHHRDSFGPGLLNRWLLSRLADGVVTFSEQARLRLVRQFRLAEERVVRINPALAPEAFVPVPEAGRQRMRLELGFGESDVVLGVVARFQKYRKMDLFLQAFAEARKTAPQLRAMLVGRGSQLQETVVNPVRQMGLESHIKLAGYLTDRYREGLAAMDVFVFLIAGSDGTARAMREAMALGRPVIANNIGMLPELNESGKTGLIFNDTADDLARCMAQLASNQPLRQELGKGAALKAQTEFCLDKQATALTAFYTRRLQAAGGTA
jgi:glycosyltransferase involved in cell wall biosynthesis